MIIRTGAPAGTDRHRHRNRNRPRPPRLAFRLAAVGLLLMGAGGSAYLGEERSRARERAEAAAAAVAHRAELGALRRLAEANRRTDRDRRSPLAETIEQAEARAQEAARQRVSRADGVKESPPPPAPPPRPEPEPAAGAPAGPVPGSCGGYSGNRATGCTLLLAAGWSLDQMSCLDSLWTKESGWNHQAQNPSSGAYGIPQALPGDKMATHGDDWRTNPATQIRWGLDYLDNRYGSPCAAWQFSQANGWY